MTLWQPDAAEKMSNFLRDFLKSRAYCHYHQHPDGIDDIKIYGSVKNPADLDIYSDVDMEITMLDNLPIDIKALLNAAADEFSPVFGYEVISHSLKDAVRVCFENGMRFDLIFRYPSDKEPLIKEHSLEDSFLSKIADVANQFWFMASMVLAKLGRNDNLIAAHLVLELCQMVIVIQMLVRDNEKGTNIHRFGGGEDVPALHSPIHVPNRPHSKCRTVDAILTTLFSAAAHMDMAMETQKSDILISLAVKCGKECFHGIHSRTSCINRA